MGFQLESIEFIAGVVGLTVFRIAWIIRRPLPLDVPRAIMPGLANLGRFLRGDRSAPYAPYGLIWHGMNLPLAKPFNYNGRAWMLLLSVTDVAFVWLSLRMGLYGSLAYAVIGTFQLFRAPWNTSINWLILLGLYNPWFLIIAPVAKLPVGLPVRIFGHTRVAFFYRHNFVYYGLLGTLWIVVFDSLFVPAIVDVSITALGLSWGPILAYLYLTRKRS